MIFFVPDADMVLSHRLSVDSSIFFFVFLEDANLVASGKPRTFIKTSLKFQSLCQVG
jgi:hypothetical protein